MSEQPESEPIVLVAFGTSVAKAQAALENIDTEVRKAYPNRDIRWAFTSQFILKKLRKQNRTTLFARKLPLKSLPEVYADLAAEGVRAAVVQSLHIAPGQEYVELLKVPTGGIQVRYGQPLLADQARIEEFAQVLSSKFGGADEVTVLAGHGNDHHPEYNRELVLLDTYLQKHNKHVYVATVEGQPGTEKPLAAAKASGKKRVKFVPIMVVAGDHVMNDVMGDEPDSWKSILKLPATSTGGLGMNNEVVALFLDRLAAAMAQ
jgi:sirohydrochlorin cobaltochelatase